MFTFLFLCCCLGVFFGGGLFCLLLGFFGVEFLGFLLFLGIFFFLHEIIFKADTTIKNMSRLF